MFGGISSKGVMARELAMDILGTIPILCPWEDLRAAAQHHTQLLDSEAPEDIGVGESQLAAIRGVSGKKSNCLLLLDMFGFLFVLIFSFASRSQSRKRRRRRRRIKLVNVSDSGISVRTASVERMFLTSSCRPGWQALRRAAHCTTSCIAWPTLASRG